MNRAKRKQIIKRISVLFVLIAVVIMSVFGGGFTASTVYAASNDVSFDDTYVMDDLESMTINGKAFDITDYGFDESRSTNIIMFVEYCYSYYANQQGNYGLYVYVWNPKGLNIDVNSSLNMITLGFDSDYSESYTKYHLEFLSMCEETNYVGLFYKFKVYLSDSDKTYILNRLDSSERFYHVSEIELLTAGDTNATATTINLEYRFSGYAAGYGNNNSSESTLVCNTEQGEVLTLDVQSTYYRPSGYNTNSEYMRDTLHSVYFSVPNSILEQYGELAAVHATWLNAQTTPIFVTGNYTYYKAFLDLVAIENADTDYAFHTSTTGTYWGGFYIVNYSYGYNYTSNVENILSALNYVFYAGSGTDSADSYTLSSEDILAWLESYTANFGGELVNDKYSSALFAQVDSEFTDITIRSTDEYKLTSITSSQNWWQRIWGTSTESETTYEMSAIQQVTLSDMDNALSVTSFCDSFYVAESDYDDLYSYVKEAESNDETVFLFRYYQSEYYSVELSEGIWETGLYIETVGDSSSIAYGRHYVEEDTNAYLAQMWVQLDFDIIDVTFTNGGVDTIIPVAMSPVDLVADADSPLETTSDGCGNWESIVMVLALLVLLIILLPVLPYIVKLVVWIICLPFKAIAAIYKAIKSANKRRRSDQ